MIGTVYYKSKVGLIRDSIQSDCIEIAKRMRKADIDEVWASHRASPLEATMHGFKHSVACFTVEVHGFPIIIFGLVPDNFTGNKASVWMLSTDGIMSVGRVFIRHSREMIDLMLSYYPYLYNFCDMRNTVTLEWLKYVGAVFGEIVPVGIDNTPFQKFSFAKDNKELSKHSFRKEILSIEEKMSKLPNVMLGDCFPLKHNFTDGIYTREISIPKGHLLISKIHKFSHPVFVMEGDISILSEEGIKRIKAPCMLISPVGAKRIGYAHENTKWVTVHRTNETDLKKIEEELIAKNFSDLTAEENRFIDIFIKE